MSMNNYLVSALMGTCIVISHEYLNIILNKGVGGEQTYL